MRLKTLTGLGIIGIALINGAASAAAPSWRAGEPANGSFRPTTSGYILPADDPFGARRDPAGRPISPGR